MLDEKMEEFNVDVQNEFEDLFASDDDKNKDDNNEIFIDADDDSGAVIEEGDVPLFDFSSL